MYKPSIYDRISARREALEEEARLAKLAEAAKAAEPQPEAEPVPVALQEVASGFTFGGFNLQFPGGFRFRDIQTTLEHEGEAVSLNIRRRDVRAGQTLEQLFESAIQALRELNPQMRVIRQRDCHVAGSPAKALDFHFKAGHEPRHGRLVGALVPVDGSDMPQWLDIACVIDPTSSGMSHWLAEFDRMLDGLALR
ncbi:DcrB-related protein [Pseudomonas sp. MN1F]|uniref:DcrB-related protein n=1 Tax=Pseudomonas sp. MN1F TaxID=1366632 RepID=UPI00128F7654|nr:DcrB-related protein [Pseudomonas sp. MN1F]MQG91982.1 DUF1795 domain-containing protein [Pseudomonas sp. MN1F]